jgi:hypothetical protein
VDDDTAESGEAIYDADSAVEGVLQRGYSVVGYPLLQEVVKMATARIDEEQLLTRITTDPRYFRRETHYSRATVGGGACAGDAGGWR